MKDESHNQRQNCNFYHNIIHVYDASQNFSFLEAVQGKRPQFSLVPYYILVSGPAFHWPFRCLAMSKAAFFAPMTDCSMAEADASMAFTETRPPLTSKTKDGNEAFEGDKRNATKTVGQSMKIVNNLDKC